jgi:hypothetical protein
MHLSLKGSLKSSLIFTYVKTDQALDLGNLEPFTIPDLSGNANTATLNSGIYVSTNGTTDKAIGADATALGSGNYYLTGKIKPAGTTAKTTMNGSTASNLTGLTAGVWQDFQTATASAITPSSINLGWDGTAFNTTVDNWSDVKLHDASDDSVVAHWKLYDSAAASLGGYLALDCVGGYHGAHVGCAGGASEAGILQTAGEDFNKRMWFDGVDDYVEYAPQNFTSKTINAVFTYDANADVRVFAIGDNAGGSQVAVTLNCTKNGNSDIVIGLDSLGNLGIDDLGLNHGDLIELSVTTNASKSVISGTVNGVAIGATDADNRSGLGLKTVIGTHDGISTVRYTGIFFSLEIEGDFLVNNTGATDAAWVDQIGSNNGTVNGSPSLFHVAESETTAGQDAFGTAIVNPRPNERVLNLTTGTGYAEIADNNSLDLGTSSLVTQEFWIKIEDGSVNHRIIDKFSSVNGIGLQYISSISSIRVTIKTQSNSASTWDGATDIADGQWHHIIVRLNNRRATPVAGDVSLLIDGADDSATLFTSASNLTATLTNAEQLYIGFSNDFPTQKLVGQIGDVRQYDRALTADEVLKNYNARKGAYGL